MIISTSVENQQTADERIPILLQVSAAVRLVSVEPMLEAIDLSPTWMDKHRYFEAGTLDWVICGAESGPNRRPCKIEWGRNIVRQCEDAGVPVFVKQLNINGKVSHNMDEWPEDLRVQEYPEILKK